MCAPLDNRAVAGYLNCTATLLNRRPSLPIPARSGQMRSRDLRPFTVEIKSKRRNPATTPASIWADTEAILKAAAEPAGCLLGGRGEPIEVRRTEAAAAPTLASQARRVLPDLRAMGPETEPAAGADKAVARKLHRTRTLNRKGGEAMPHDTKHQPKRASASDLTASMPDPNRASAAEPEALAVAGEGAMPIAVPAEIVPPAGDAPIIVHRAARPGRRWARRADDLPRGERWKRRLPEVCR